MATVSAQEFLKGGKPSLVLPASTNFGVPQVQGQEQPGFFSNLKNDIVKRVDTVKNFANTKGPTAPGAFEKFGVGVGQAIGAVGDVVGEGAKSLYGQLPQGVQDVVGPAVKKSFASALIDTVVPGAKTIPEPLKDFIGEKLKPRALEALQGGVETYQTFKKKNPVAATEFESALNILSAIPIGKGAKAVGETGVGTTGKALQKVGSAVENTAGITKSLGTKAYEAALPLSEKEAQLLQTYKASTPLKDRLSNFFAGQVTEGKPRLTAQTAAEKNLKGTESMLGVQAKRETEKLWSNTIQPALQSIPDKIQADDMFVSVEKEIAKIKDRTKRKSFIDALESIKEDYKGVSDFSYEEAQGIKSELDQSLPEKMFRGQNVTGAANNVRKYMADFIRNKTYKALQDVNIRKDYLDYGNLKGLMKLGTNAMKSQKLKGGFGSFVSGLTEYAVTPVATIGGQTLYRVANGMHFVAEKGLKKFGQYLEKFVK